MVVAQRHQRDRQRRRRHADPHHVQSSLQRLHPTGRPGQARRIRSSSPIRVCTRRPVHTDAQEQRRPGRQLRRGSSPTRSCGASSTVAVGAAHPRRGLPVPAPPLVDLRGRRRRHVGPALVLLRGRQPAAPRQLLTVVLVEEPLADHFRGFAAVVERDGGTTYPAICRAVAEDDECWPCSTWHRCPSGARSSSWPPCTSCCSRARSTRWHRIYDTVGRGARRPLGPLRAT